MTFVAARFSAYVAKKGVRKLVDKGKDTLVKKALIGSPTCPRGRFSISGETSERG